MIINLIFIFSLGLLDKLRGSGWITGTKAIFQVLYGMATAYLLCFNDINPSFILIFSAFFTLGISFGWGEPLGAFIANRPLKLENLESWQFGILKKNAALAVIFRGLLWGLCTLPAAYYSLNLTLTFILSITISFFLAALITRLWSRENVIAWELHEFIRGTLLAVIILLIQGRL